MRKATKWYMSAVSVSGLLAGGIAVWRFLIQSDPFVQSETLGPFLVLLVFCWGCCCLPLYIRDDCTVDLSFIAILASTLYLGPNAAVTICMLTYPLIIVPSPDGHSYSHIFNTHFSKTMFNMACRNLSVALGGLAYSAGGGIPGNISLPGVLLPALLFIAVAMLVNVVTVMFYFVIEQQARIFPTIFQMFLGLAPSITCTAPIGYFLAMLLRMEGGIWLSMLFMLPLLLARFSFKLYLDSRKQQYNILRTLAAALEAKDQYTEGHSQRVGYYAERIGRQMGLGTRQLDLLRSAAVFHDIGKIGVPDSILQKPSPLTQEEFEVIRQHPIQGVRILKNLAGYDEIIPLVLHHHEFYDGGGYPDGTKGDEVPLAVYVLGVADAYDAITSDRPYRAGRTPREAALILRRESGKQFHPQVASITADMVERGLLERPDSLALAMEG
ncbi:MAG: HD-GYP domain-containing protein [Clostridiaceae bacterium]|nr:HD-GYP domain-containing protein [Clostridiaceae bacterium]